MVEGAERDIVCKIQKGVHQGKHEDAVLVAMKELEKSKGKTLRKFRMGTG